MNDVAVASRTGKRERPGEPMEADAAAGPKDKLPLRLEGWPRLGSATLPQVSFRTLEIADAISTAAWKTLRVSHSFHRLGGGSKPHEKASQRTSLNYPSGCLDNGVHLTHSSCVKRRVRSLTSVVRS